MRCDMSDSQFLASVNLRHPSMRQAAALARQGRTRPAARAAARALFAQPFPHPVNEADIPALAESINQRWPDQVQWLTRLADNYLLVEPPRSGLVSGRNPEEESALYRQCARPWKHRGEAVHALARLYCLTGDRKYREGALAAMRQLLDARPSMPDGDDAGAFSWHPNSIYSTHEPGHIAEKVCHALPYLRADLTDDEALLFAKALLAMAEFCERTCRYDVCHNITLHMFTGALLVGLCFPAFQQAGQWVETVQRRLEDDFVGRAFVTSDGYFGEGFSYQGVNHNLMQVCLRYFHAAGRKVSPKLRKVCERSFEFASGILRTDGLCPSLGDAHAQQPHEHYIQHHEMLHYAAAFFRRPDFKAAAGSPYGEEPMEYNIWLMGLDGLAWYDSVHVPPRSHRPQQPQDFRASGLQFLGLGDGLNAHSGLFACAAAHNHAHSDFGSIDLTGLGRSLLTDSSVTSYEEDSYRHERAHNAVVPVRRAPQGPRLDRPDHVKTLFVLHADDIQAACMEHDLYETHRIRRTLCLVNAQAARNGPTRRGAGGLHPDDVPAFWLVIDRVERAWPYPGATEPEDFLETYFHFNAPQSELGRDDKTLTVWSKHNPAGLTLLRYRPTDVDFQGKPQKVRLDDHLKAYETSSSDANLQVTAVPPAQPDRYITDMRLFQGFTGEYHGRVKRPSMAYRWRGFLPFDAAYILIPFRGVRNKPYANVTGQWSRTGDLTVTVHLPQGPVRLTAKGLTAAKPKPAFTVKTAKP